MDETKDMIGEADGENDRQLVSTDRYPDHDSTTTTVSTKIELLIEIDEIDVEVLDEEWDTLGDEMRAKEELKHLIEEKGVEVLDTDYVRLQEIQTDEPF